MVLREYDEIAHIENEKKLSFEDGFNDGFSDGELSKEEQFSIIAIQDYLDNGLSMDEILEKLVTKYLLPKEKAEKYLSTCMKNNKK